MKTTLPERPFTTADFSLRGGGIDFLGLRWVSLTIVGRDLVPELNNVTTDMGSFILGAWIPWKFRELCLGEDDYTEENYQAFREKVEVALSLTMRHDLDIERPFGSVRNKIGITQKFEFPQKLNFDAVSRGENNTLFAAAIYGPSLVALGMIDSYYSLAQKGGRSLKIPIPAGDDETTEMVRSADSALRKSSCYSKFASLSPMAVDAKAIRNLANAGLDPAFYRGPSAIKVKSVFRARLLPKDASDPGFARTLTTRLMLTTLADHEGLTSWELRKTWYTGMYADGTRFFPSGADLVSHSQRWSCFVARQYQRFFIELFLWCFEDGIGHGCRSIEQVVTHWLARTKKAKHTLPATFRDLAFECAGPLLHADERDTSREWNRRVHGSHKQYEDVPDPQGDEAVGHGLRMLAGWYWRMLVRSENNEIRPLLTLGGSDRMSMDWFLRWVSTRKTLPIRDLLNDIFSDLIFTQHMRVALARFDGTAQRLRFVIGDGGIEPTLSARTDLGQRQLPWMPDRLDMLIGLLCDCDVLRDDDEKIYSGPKYRSV